MRVWIRRASTVAAVLVVASACSSGNVEPSTPTAPADSAVPGSALASPSPEPTVPASMDAVATATPTPTPFALPTPPPDLVRVAVTERDRIRVRIELERNPLPAGERSWVKVSVTNRGKSDVTWYHDGCALPVIVYGASQVAWPMGSGQPPQGLKFKTYALGGHIAEVPSPYGTIQFVRKERLAKGRSGCADIGIADTIEPGRSVRQTLWWSGFTGKNWALPPTGPATIAGFAGYYWRGADEPEAIEEAAMELQLEAWISDGGDHLLSPAQAVDAALADPAFATYLETQALANGREEIAWYDADRDLWEIGVMPWYETDPPRIHGVLVDAETGRILGPLDRAWDEEKDHFP